MNRELIIDSGPSEVLIALLENKKLVELHREKNSNTFSVGDIYLGKVKRIVQGLNAAFIDIGYEKDAFQLLLTLVTKKMLFFITSIWVRRYIP